MSDANANAADARLRLCLEHFVDGWGWRGWEQNVDGEWRSLPTPALPNQQRRFRTQEDAERFFGLLAECLLETATEYVSARRLVRRRL